MCPHLAALTAWLSREALMECARSRALWSPRPFDSIALHLEDPVIPSIISRNIPRSRKQLL
jgi:hypothetical protein